MKTNNNRKSIIIPIFLILILFFSHCAVRTDLYVNRDDYEIGIFGIISSILFIAFIAIETIKFITEYLESRPTRLANSERAKKIQNQKSEFERKQQERDKEIDRFCQQYPDISREDHAYNYDILSGFENMPIEDIKDEQTLNQYCIMVFMYRVDRTESEENRFNHPQILKIGEQLKKLHQNKLQF